MSLIQPQLGDKEKVSGTDKNVEKDFSLITNIAKIVKNRSAEISTLILAGVIATASIGCKENSAQETRREPRREIRPSQSRSAQVQPVKKVETKSEEQAARGKPAKKVETKSVEGLTIKEKMVNYKRYYFYENEDGQPEFGSHMFEMAEPFSYGVALVSRSIAEGYYFINRNGVNAFGDLKFDAAKSLKNGIAPVKRKEGRYYYLNAKGDNAFRIKNIKNMMVGVEFDFATEFSEGLARVIEHNYYYYINTSGENAFGNKKFAKATSFKEGFAVVTEQQESKGEKERWYYINKNGDRAFGGQEFEKAGEFENGFANVVKGIRPYVIDKTGQQVKK